MGAVLDTRAGAGITGTQSIHSSRGGAASQQNTCMPEMQQQQQQQRQRQPEQGDVVS